jgi:D-alanyl-D-alanine-carboxypeptidase/D-alanyl-D-alanine-endopeptidase
MTSERAAFLNTGLLAACAFAAASLPWQAAQADKLLDETVEFAGTVIFIEAKVPGFVIGAVRNGESAVFGFGETAKGSGKTPDGDTRMRIASITKVFAGATLASMVAKGEIGFTDLLQERLGWDVKIPERDGKQIRLIDLATHASGLPREAAFGTGDVTSNRSKEDYVKSLNAPDPLLFAPGTGVLYSNFGFDLLAQALANTAGKPYPELLKERVLDPAGLTGTSFDLSEAEQANAMQGHNFDGSPMPFIPTSPMIVGAGGLYSTANDLVRWLKWHLDRFSPKDAEMRLLDHVPYLERDTLDVAFGMDEGGTMDAMGLGWVVMRPEGSRPLIMHKSGGLQGQFSFIAFAPTRGVGVFASMNEFSVDGFDAMSKAVLELIAELAPR